MSLQMYAAIYKTAQTKYDSMFIDPPCGDYQCRVVDASYKETQKNGNTYNIFSWTLQIISNSEQSGLRFERREFLPNSIDEAAEKKLGFIKGAIERCGVHAPAEVFDLPQAMKYCIGAELDVSVIDSGSRDKNGKVIKNIKFLKLLARQSEAAPAPLQKTTPQNASFTQEDIDYFNQPQFIPNDEVPY